MANKPVTGETRLAAVLGDPVAHSLSPALFNAAFAATGLDWVFVALRVPLENGVDAFAGVRSMGFSGLSVTMPLKQIAYESLDVRSEAVEQLNAANCVYVKDGLLVGENTDGEGFLRGIKDDLDMDVNGKRTVVVGAGGAARAVIYALAQAGATDVAVLNRTHENAKAAAKLGGSVGRVGDSSDLGRTDLVVQATSVGMNASDSMPFDVAKLGPKTCVADLIYRPSPTPVLEAATANGHRVTDGRSMLLHQAAIAFELWTNQSAPLDVMRAQMFGS